ncbi:Imm1 family immunity protein [Paractinoplanes durhamensis]|uniref:Immunity protein Imm1 n=1 Tax=Paractinoplanes durhamensis TaxID=113563 RepID=A0ABQ3Z563_9ACTN|nr:Imm1 family immunity protein [Actinoplanes durhamensis]GIE04980.1 hypothetical protein Adu01nite_63300 [Actinoplanes durhamensis]
MATVVWGDEPEERAVVSAEDVREVLVEVDRLAAEHPLIVDVTVDSGDTLGVALGGDVSVLLFGVASKKPPYFVSRGRAPRRGDGVVGFGYFGSRTEFLESQVIPLRDALDAACLFVADGERPGNVGWTEV